MVQPGQLDGQHNLVDGDLVIDFNQIAILQPDGSVILIPPGCQLVETANGEFLVVKILDETQVLFVVQWCLTVY